MLPDIGRGTQNSVISQPPNSCPSKYSNSYGNDVCGVLFAMSIEALPFVFQLNGGQSSALSPVKPLCQDDKR